MIQMVVHLQFVQQHANSNPYDLYSKRMPHIVVEEASKSEFPKEMMSPYGEIEPCITLNGARRANS